MIESSRRNIQRSTLNAQIGEVVEAFARRTSVYLRSALDTTAATTILFALAHWRGSQVVRSRSAKPLFAGSIPAPASQSRAALVDNVILFPPSGSVDSLVPACSPATLAGRPSMSAAPCRLHPAPACFCSRGRSLGSAAKEPLPPRR